MSYRTILFAMGKVDREDERKDERTENIRKSIEEQKEWEEQVRKGGDDHDDSKASDK